MYLFGISNEFNAINKTIIWLSALNVNNNNNNSNNLEINSNIMADGGHMQHITYTPSSTIPSAAKITGTETIEGTTMIILDLVKEQHKWR